MSLKITQLFVVVFFTVVSHSTHAATINFLKGYGTNDDRISISGEIKDGDEQKFKEIALLSDRAIVYLEGPGGDLGAAIRIGRLVYALGYMTAVKETQCASACALIWVAGHFKFLSTNAQVGFHLPAYDEESKKGTKNISVVYALTGAYLANLGFAEPFIAYMMDTENDQIKWLTSKNAKFFGVAIFELAP